MSGKGLFPPQGVPAGSQQVAGGVSYAPEIEPVSGCDVLYHKFGCRPEFSREQANYLLANFLGVVDKAGLPYDCADALLLWKAMKLLACDCNEAAPGTPPGAITFNIPSTHVYNFKDDVAARGYDVATPLNIVATLPSGNVLGSSLIDTCAFDTGSGWHASTTLKLITQAGSHIIGRGGNGANGEASGYGNGANGGPAFKAQRAITVDNNGTIAGGGGGGARVGGSNSNWAGNNGVSGGAYGAGIHTTDPSTFKSIFYYFYAIAYWDHPGNYAGGGAPGGEWGQPGSGAGSGTVGGNPGACILSGNSLISWLSTGTRIGAINA